MLPDGDVFVDLTIANASCKSHANKDWQQIENKKDVLKKEIYEQLVLDQGGEFTTCVMEVFGRLGIKAKQLIKRIERAANATPGALTSLIATANMRLNGAIIGNVARCNRLAG